MFERKGKFIAVEYLVQTRDRSEFEVKNIVNPVDEQTLRDLMDFAGKIEDVLFYGFVYAKGFILVSEITSFYQRTGNCICVSEKGGASTNVRGHVDDLIKALECQ